MSDFTDKADAVKKVLKEALDKNMKLSGKWIEAGLSEDEISSIFIVASKQMDYGD